MTKHMIRCDMEGVSGIVSPAQAEPGATEYKVGLCLFMSDLLAAIGGLREGGADTVVVYDEHYFGRNIDLTRLPANVSVIAGKPPYRADWAGGLDESFAGLVLVGFHSRCGSGELLHHTYEPDICGLALNGLAVGEIGMEAAIAGDFGVPTVLVTADSAGTAEAEELLPGVLTVAVKESLGATGALCPGTAVTAARIRAAARAAVLHAPAVEPFRVSAPVHLEVSLCAGSFQRALADTFPEVMQDERSLAIDGSTVTEVWSRYWDMKKRAQDLVAAVGPAP